MRNALLPILLNIDYLPQLNHPLLQAYIDPDVELGESHIDCIADAIEYADKVMYDNRS